MDLAGSSKRQPKDTREKQDKLKHKREREPKLKEPAYSEDEDEYDSDDDGNELDILDSLNSFFVSTDGVSLADSGFMIAKSLASASQSLEKLVKLVKMQTKTLQQAVDLLSETMDDEDSVLGAGEIAYEEVDEAATCESNNPPPP